MAHHDRPPQIYNTARWTAHPLKLRQLCDLGGRYRMASANFPNIAGSPYLCANLLTSMGYLVEAAPGFLLYRCTIKTYAAPIFRLSSFPNIKLFTLFSK